MLHFPSSDIGMFGRRQRHARGHRIPVTIATDATKAAQSAGTLRVTDAFGADDVMLFGATCQCCTVRLELQRVLRRLLAARRQGASNFSRILIETRNDPGPVLRTFATERALGAEFYVEEEPVLPATDGIRNFVLTEDAPLSWDAFSRFIAALTALRGADLSCTSGLLNIAGCRGPVVVQYRQHLALQPVELQAWPDYTRSRLTFVTRGVPERAVRDLFDAVRALA